MEVTIKVFASAKDLCGSDQIILTVPAGAALRDLYRHMEKKVPALKGIAGRWAVNLEFVSDDYILQAQDELAWITPVSGG